MSQDGVSAEEVVASMAHRSGLLAQDREWEVESEWPSFSAHFWLLRSGGDRIVLKLGSNWSGDTVSYVAEENDRVSRLLAAVGSGRMVMPAVLGVSTDPPALGLEFHSGDPLFSVLADLDTTERNDLLALCGAGIGAFHSADPATDDPASTEAALEELRRAAKRAVVGWSKVAAIEPGLARARGYRFSPNDFLVTEEGRLVFLDPPHVRKYDYVHRDLASFLMELHRSLAGEGRPSADRLGLLAETRRAFLDGYRETGPAPLNRSDDALVIDLFQTARISGVLQGRLRTAKPGAAVRALSWWRWVRPR